MFDEPGNEPIRSSRARARDFDDRPLWNQSSIMSRMSSALETPDHFNDASSSILTISSVSVTEWRGLLVGISKSVAPSTAPYQHSAPDSTYTQHPYTVQPYQAGALHIPLPC